MEQTRYSPAVSGVSILAIFTIFVFNSAVAQVQPEARAGALPGVMQPDLNHWELQAQTEDELYIPPTMERPLSEEAGPRIDVNTLKLSIDPKLDSRMTPELRASLDQVLNNLVIENQAAGFTIGRLERAAASVTDHLREGGFILAWAFLPQQNVDNKTVVIEVLSGTLEGVNVDGNNRHKTKRLIGPFEDLLGLPVEKDGVEESILMVRNFPGLSTSAVFSPGSAVGSSMLTLRVSEDPFDAAFVVDNHGTESTGSNRVRADMSWYNPFGVGDSLAINVLQTFDPAENLYGGLEYAVPIFRPDLTMSLGFSHNAFEVASGLAAGAGVDGKNLAGDTDVGFIGLSKNLHLARRSRVDLGVDLIIKNAVLENLGRETEDNLTIAVLYLTTELVDRIGNGGINQFDLRYHNGIPDFLGSMDESGDGGQSTRTGGSGKAAGGDFSKFTLRYQRLQRISKRNSLLFRAEAQFSDDLLTSIEQFVIGGPNSVRAYPIAEYLGDEGTFGSLEWIFQVVDKPNSSFSISAFGDFANGKLNDPLANEIADQDLSGWGVGLSFTRTADSGNQFGFRLDIATPTSDPDPSNGDDPQYYGSMFYSFR